MKQVSYILITLIVLLDFSCKNTNNKWEVYCKKSYYNEYLTDEKIQELELDIVQKLDSANFQGTFAIKEDSLVFGWHERKLNASNSVSIKDALKNNGFYAVYHRINKWTYLKKVAGFIDDNCGIIYLPDGKEMPVQVKSKSRIRKSHNGKGDWFFVETKL